MKCLWYTLLLLLSLAIGGMQLSIISKISDHSDSGLYWPSLVSCSTFCFFFLRRKLCSCFHHQVVCPNGLLIWLLTTFNLCNCKWPIVWSPELILLDSVNDIWLLCVPNFWLSRHMWTSSSFRSWQMFSFAMARRPRSRMVIADCVIAVTTAERQFFL